MTEDKNSPQEELNEIATEASETDVATEETPEEISASPAPEEQVSQNKTEKKKSSGGAIFLSLLAIVAAGLALAGSYYLYKQQTVISKKLPGFLPKAELQSSLNKGINAKTAKLDSDIANLNELLDSKIDEIATASEKKVASRVNTLNQRVDSLREQNKQLQNRLVVMSNRVNKIEKVALEQELKWVLQEVKYLITIAGHKLTFQQDIQTAVAALTTADEKLKSLRNSDLFELRQAIAADKNLLLTVKLPDIDAIAEQLLALEKTIRTLPTKKPTFNPKIKDKKENKGSSRAWSTFKDSISDYVVIRNSDSKVKPFISLQEREYLNQNIELKIQTALIALSNLDAVMFKRDLAAIEEWIMANFDNNDSKVAKAKEIIWEIKRADIHPQIPKLTNSINALNLELAKVLAPAVNPDETGE